MKLVAAAVLLSYGALASAAAFPKHAELLAGSRELTVKLSSDHLYECDTTTVTWSNSLQGENVTTSVQANVYIDGFHLGNAWANADSETISSWDFEAVYPAGSTVEFDVYMSRPDLPGQSGKAMRGNTIKVQIEKGDSSCIPAAHYPVLIDSVSFEDVSVCETSVIRWSGGAPPYTVQLDWDAKRHGNLTTFRRNSVLGQTNDTSFGWLVDFPAQSTVGITILSWMGNDRHGINTNATGPLKVDYSAKGDFCVPGWHKNSHSFPLWATIIMSVTGGILGLVLISATTLYAWRKYQSRKAGQPISI